MNIPEILFQKLNVALPGSRTTWKDSELGEITYLKNFREKENTLPQEEVCLKFKWEGFIFELWSYQNAAGPIKSDLIVSGHRVEIPDQDTVNLVPMIRKPVETILYWFRGFLLST